MKMWRVERTWYVEAETYADALLATGRKLDSWMPRQWRRHVRAQTARMVQARAEHISAAQCCDGTGRWEPDSIIPCANPRCPVIHPDK